MEKVWNEELCPEWDKGIRDFESLEFKSKEWTSSVLRLIITSVVWRRSGAPGLTKKNTCYPVATTFRHWFVDKCDISAKSDFLTKSAYFRSAQSDLCWRLRLFSKYITKTSITLERHYNGRYYNLERNRLKQIILWLNGKINLVKMEICKKVRFHVRWFWRWSEKKKNIPMVAMKNINNNLYIRKCLMSEQKTFYNILLLLVAFSSLLLFPCMAYLYSALICIFTVLNTSW